MCRTPVRASRPTKMSAPTPEASRPGSSTTPSMGPPRPEASISRNAPAMGEPRRVLIAAKLPAAATTAVAWAGMSRLASRTASTASPPPRAISGASGPSTTPRLRVASAASSTPGSWAGVGAPSPALNPSAGEWPPFPGRNRIDRRDQQAGQRQDGKRPPRRRAVKAQPVGEMSEDLALQVGDKLKEPVGRGGHWHAEQSGEDQQSQIALAPQQNLGVLLASSSPSSCAVAIGSHLTSGG